MKQQTKYILLEDVLKSAGKGKLVTISKKGDVVYLVACHENVKIVSNKSGERFSVRADILREV